eukprot:UN10812
MNWNTREYQAQMYDMKFFADLPISAQKAAINLQTFAKTNENARSHWSDLFRLAVLYKFGGVYSDIDSIWFRPLHHLTDAVSFIPLTPYNENTELGNNYVIKDGQRFFLEGGIMKFPQNSQFLYEILSNFPKYTENR